MKIEKMVCDNCMKETKLGKMYLTFDGDNRFGISVSHSAGRRHFIFTELDFCCFECFKEFLEELLLK